MDPKVLIVGAGPTGLAIALWLARIGVKVRIVERNRGPGEASRAIAVHARTLELYRQLGIDREIVAAGLLVERLMLRRGRREIAALRIGDFGRGLSPYPYVLSLPQDEHERLLGAALQRLGVAIEWNTRLESFVDDGTQVRAVLSHDGRRSDCVADFIAGCDGAHSTVREQLGIAFPGGTYEQRFFVADVEATGAAASRDLNVCLAGPTFCIVLPVRSLGSTRLIGVVPPELGEHADVTFENLRGFAEDLCGLRIGAVNWFSTYHVHHRVAERFRAGRAFLCGDAAHIHSPAGGQGMNTGIGDALNLAWKLGAVAGGGAKAALLDSYEPERMAFARLLVATTDRAFRAIVGTGLANRLFRTLLLPTVVPLALQFAGPRRQMFRLLSQTRIAYPSSPLSEGRAGRVHGGDRLPWVGDGVDNYAPLQSLDWQIHVHGTPVAAVLGWAALRRLKLHRFDWTPAAQRAGYARDAAYLVRPDGYVAVAAPATDVAPLEDFVTDFGLRMRA